MLELTNFLCTLNVYIFFIHEMCTIVVYFECVFDSNEYKKHQKKPGLLRGFSNFLFDNVIFA